MARNRARGIRQVRVQRRVDFIFAMLFGGLVAARVERSKVIGILVAQAGCVCGEGSRNSE
jgi:hypothetical protein